MMMSITPYGTHPEVMISRAKFDASTSSSFGRVKEHVLTHVQIELCFIQGVRKVAMQLFVIENNNFGLLKILENTRIISKRL